MMPILEKLKNELKPYAATLVAVSKTKSIEEIKAVYDEGQRVFGENRIQELMEKIPQLPSDIKWHLIGHLQSNKIKYLTPSIALIHSVDSINLIESLQRHGQKSAWVIPILLQLKIAKEETKSGFDFPTLKDFLITHAPHTFSHLQFCGVMGIGTLSDDPDLTRREFKQLKSMFEELKRTIFKDYPLFSQVSMGMSHDYQIALEEGATMVRVGSLVFGGRH